MPARRFLTDDAAAIALPVTPVRAEGLPALLEALPPLKRSAAKGEKARGDKKKSPKRKAAARKR